MNNWFYPCSACFLIFGIIWIKIEITMTIFAVVGFLMVFVPLFILTVYLPMNVSSLDDVNPDLIIVIGFCMFSFIYWNVVRASRDCCLRSCNSKFFSEFMVIVCCLVLWVFLFALIASEVIFPEASEDFSEKGYYILQVVLCLIILIVWSFIQYKYLYKSKEDIEKEENKNVRRVLRIRQQKLNFTGSAAEQEQQMREFEFAINQKGLTSQRRHDLLAEHGINIPVEIIEQHFQQMKTTRNAYFYLNFVGNICVGLAFVLIEFILINYLMSTAREGDETDETSTEIIMKGFICTFLLIFILVFIPFTSSTIKMESKSMIITFMVAFIPIFGINFLYNEFEEDEYIGKLMYVLLFTGPVFCVYLLTLSYLRKKGDNIFKAFLTISVFCLLFPLWYGVALYMIDVFSATNVFFVISICLMSGGGIVVIGFYFYYLWKKYKEIKINKIKFSEMSFKDSTVWLNSTGAVVSLSILIFVFFRNPEIAEVKRGTVLSICGLILLLCIAVNLVLSLKVENTQGHRLFEYRFQSLFNRLFGGNEKGVNKEDYSQESKYQKTAVFVGFFAPPVIFIPAYFLISIDVIKYACMSFFVGCLFATIFFLFVVEIKKRAGLYGKNCLPLSLCCIWIFIFIPFLVILPIAVVYLGSSEENFKNIVGTAIALISLLFMTGVSIGAIVLNEVFKRIEYEKKAKYCVMVMGNKLEEVAVKTNPLLLRIIYDQYINLTKDGVKKLLLNNTLANYWNIPKNHPDLKFSKIMLDYDTHAKLKKSSSTFEEKRKMQLEFKRKKEEERKALEQKQREEALKRKKARIFCACCYESDEELPPEEDKNKEQPQPDDDEEENLVVRENEEDVFQNYENADYGMILDQLKNKNDQATGLYQYLVKPFDPFEDEDQGPEEDMENLDLQAFMDVVEGRSVNSEALLRQIRMRPGCERRFWDQIFKRFATGSRSRYNFYWMTHSDYEYFLKKTGILDEEEMTDDEFEHDQLELDAIFITLTEQNLKEDKIFNRLMFNKVIQEIALFKFPDFALNPSVAKERLIEEIIFPSLYSSMPHLINETFATNIIDEQFTIKRMYPKAGDLEEDDDEYIESSAVEAKFQAKDKKHRYNCCRRCCIKINKCAEFVILLPLKCCEGFSKCCGSIMSCCSTKEKKEEEEKDPMEEIFGKKGKPRYVIGRDGKRHYAPHRQSPDWNGIVDKTLESIEFGIHEYEQHSQDEEHLTLNMNFSNLITIYSKFMEIYSIAIIAFKKEVGWEISNLQEAILLAFNVESSNSSSPWTYVALFWGCFFLCVLYMFLAIPAARKARKGTLGRDANGKPSKPCSSDFFLAKSVIMLGSALYIPILKNLIDSMACNYDEKPWHLYRNEDITCWEGMHFIYIIFAFLGIILYYPLATFMYANLQFQDKALDLKYKPTFIIILSQVKLLISGMSSFFQDPEDIVIQLPIISACMFGVAFLSYKMDPCLIKPVNLWHTASFLALSWIMLGAIFVNQLDWQITAVIFMAAGVGTIAIVAYIIGRKKYQNNGIFFCLNICIKSKNKVTQSPELFSDQDIDSVITPQDQQLGDSSLLPTSTLGKERLQDTSNHDITHFSQDLTTDKMGNDRVSFLNRNGNDTEQYEEEKTQPNNINKKYVLK